VSDIVYDPYDRAIDADPHPVWRRMCDEAPVYRNDACDFWALSRFPDVFEASVDVGTYSSARGTVLDIMGKELPMRPMIFMDPPEHDRLRGLVSRAFSPRRLAELEPAIRRIVRSHLERHEGGSGFDFVADFGAKVPMMGVSAMLGVPEEDREEIRAWTDETLHRMIYADLRTRFPEHTLMLSDRLAMSHGLEMRSPLLDDELADYYRSQLLGADTGQRLGRKKFLALEALLRLRQAASHQGLLLGVGPDGNGDGPPASDGTELSSAKLDFLTERVEEVLEEHSHKALVFSQFTSLLAFVKERFDRRGWRYAYLDGSTTRRDQVVREFQEDPECRLFLISLKAGGVGLNLTAADYVFLLDPWWNPAVEQQAIDRAHRIGQTRPVMAYRLLTKDTVEERVAELQEHKRGLAEALLGSDKSLAAELTKEDLEVLLS